MAASLRFAFFGSSLRSSYMNEPAGYFRGVIRALHMRGHRITFYEPDISDHVHHQDIRDHDWAEVVLYSCDESDGVLYALKSARKCDVLVKAGRVGVFDDLLAEKISQETRRGCVTVYWDTDVVSTLGRLHKDPNDPLAASLHEYDIIFTRGGGQAAIDDYIAFGAQRCVPIYNAMDPSQHYAAESDHRFVCDLAYLSDRLSDQDYRAKEFFISAAKQMPYARFLLSGDNWEGVQFPSNVVHIERLRGHERNALDSTALAVLDIENGLKRRYGYLPTNRLFEATGAGACVITDHWDGLEHFLTPGYECLVAHSGLEVAEELRSLTPSRARHIGQSAQNRVLSDHTYAHRAIEVEDCLLNVLERRGKLNKAGISAV